MKANELMLGDYVSHFNEEKKCVVIELRGRKVAVSYTDDNGNTKYSELLPEMAFEPIPLTAEILEKNGFVYKEAEKTCATDAFHLWWLDGSIFSLNDDSWWRSIKDGKLRVKFGGFPLKYVHELQHTLRLCGIDKNIEL